MSAESDILFLRDKYFRFGGKACPACLYENGKFIRLCKLHEELREVHAELKAAEDLWMKYTVGPMGLCGLCGNTGMVDTTKSAVSPRGEPSGIKAPCICPNGQTLREHQG